MDWTERIPQAIEKAEGLLEHRTHHVRIEKLAEDRWGDAITIDRIEVALAKALWGALNVRPIACDKPGDDTAVAYSGQDSMTLDDAAEALRAFVEKVETL